MNWDINIQKEAKNESEWDIISMNKSEEMAVIPRRILKRAKITPRIRKMANTFESLLLREVEKDHGEISTQNRDICHTIRTLRIYSWEIELRIERDGIFDAHGRMSLNIERNWIYLNNLAIKLYRTLNLSHREDRGMTGLEYIDSLQDQEDED